MKWDLRLFETKGTDSAFKLHVSYGDYLPNTTLFLNGGKSLSAAGKLYTTTVLRNGTLHRVLHLKSTQLKDELLLIAFDKNILHVADGDLQLVKGDESFGFILNKTNDPHHQ